MADSQTTSGPLSIVEALGDMVWVRDARTHELLYVSSNAQAFLGLGPETPYTSQTFFDAVHPDDRPRLVAALRTAPDIYAIDFRFYKNGELRYGFARARHVYDEAGERVRIEGSTSDVTESRLREAALEVAKKRAETLTRVAERLSSLVGLDEAMKMVCEETANALAASSVAVALYDPATGDVVGRYGHGLSTTTNEFVVAPYATVVQIAPHGAQQIVDMQARPGLPHSDQVKARDIRSIAFAAFVRGSEVFGYLNVITYGQTRELSAEELALLKGIAGLAVGALVNARLFAEKEKIEARLRESEKRYRGIVETTQEGIALLDSQGIFHYCNARFAEIFDFSREEVIGQHFATLLLPADAEAMRGKLVARLDGSMARFENQITTRKGRQVWYSSTGSPTGESRRDMLVVVSDITETRRLAEKLQSAQKAESLGVLAGGVAHDFNNLLVSVLGNAGFALMELPPESPVRPVIEDIQTAAQRASELTRQLLAYSGRGRFVLARLDLGRVVEEMAHLLGAVISKNVVVRYTLAKTLPAIEGDPTQIRQIVMNLITNAADAIGDKSGVISVTTSLVEADRAMLADAFLDDELAPGRYVRLQVTDTGVGMSPETRAKIFDPFFSTKFTGRGLGLAAALGILRAHRGAIKVDSALGRGSTFEVLLPVAGGVIPSVDVAPATPSPSRVGATLLVVDDDANVRAVVKRILAQQGHTVLTAADGVEALDVYGRNIGVIDAVILDLTMPNMNGEETFRRLLALDPGVRVLLASGYAEQEATSRFAGMGLAGFLAKPFTPSELEERLAAVLAKSRARPITP